MEDLFGKTLPPCAGITKRLSRFASCRNSRGGSSKNKGRRIHEALESGRRSKSKAVRAIKEALAMRRIELVAHEVPIGGRKFGVVTFLDAVGKTADGEHCVISFKTGKPPRVSPLARCPSPLSDLPPDYECLQGACELALLRKAHGVEVKRYYLVRYAGKSEAHFRSLPSWAKNQCERILQAVLER